MEGSYRDWTSLPYEILLKIFHFAGIDEHLPDSYNEKRISTQVTLVCNSWRIPAQSFLNSHVTIYSFLQLEKFRDIIECNTYFGTEVKALNLKITYITESEKDLLLSIMTNLLSNFLPNLEYFYQDRYHSYVPILNALLDCKLKYLKSIQIPPYSRELSDGDKMVQYASCAFLMRDRLQEVFISNSFCTLWDNDELTIAKFQHLYDNLNQFNNLTKIHATIETNDILQVLEHIVDTCRSLRDIDLTLNTMYSQYDHVELKDNIAFDTTIHYIPRVNIKTLTVHLYAPQIDGSKILLYIMKKFPNLEELYFPQRTSNLQVTTYTIAQLLNYLDTIKKVSINGFTPNQDNICQFIENAWNITSKPGVVNVRLHCSNDQTIRAESTSITIEKNPGKETKLYFNCCLKFFNRQPPHIYFIEKIGKFIVDLTFVFRGHRVTGDDTSENFLMHIFMHCPYLRNLHIDNFELRECIHSNFDKTNKCSLDRLTLNHCDIDPGALKQLSMVLSEVKQLHLINTCCYNYEDGDDDNCIISYINLPQTKIQFIMVGSLTDDPAYVKLFVVNDQKYYYYQAGAEIISMTGIKPEIKIVKQIDAKVYDEVDKATYDLYDVCCLTKPEIEFEYHGIRMSNREFPVRNRIGIKN